MISEKEQKKKKEETKVQISTFYSGRVKFNMRSAGHCQKIGGFFDFLIIGLPAQNSP